jgi:tol-pal system protein YbgF
MKKQLANSFAARTSMAGAIASVMLFASVATAQDSRLSLADRVTQLEQQVQNKDQGSIGMVNQIQQLTSQIQQLQGQIEELQHGQQQLEDKNKAQYGDIDARLSRLESGAAAVPASNKAPTDNTSATTPPNNAPAAAATAPPGPVVGKANSAPAADPGAAAAYDVAFKAIRAGDYVSSSRDFRGFIQKYPSDALTPNAYYWLGESYYATMNYQVALEAFQHLLSQFPQSEKAPDATLKLGYTQLELKQVPQAKATLTSVASKYPGSKAASLAQERLRQIQQSSAN